MSLLTEYRTYEYYRPRVFVEPCVLTILWAKMKDRAVIGKRKTIVKSKDPASVADWLAVPTQYPRGTYVFGWPINGQCPIF